MNQQVVQMILQLEGESTRVKQLKTTRVLQLYMTADRIGAGLSQNGADPSTMKRLLNVLKTYEDEVNRRIPTPPFIAIV
jgi:predicted Zn-dependent protease